MAASRNYKPSSMMNYKFRTDYTALKIDRNNHAAAASAVQQMADLAPIFRGIKQGPKLVTALRSYCAILAKKLENHFGKSKIVNVDRKKLKGAIGKKLKGAINLLACLPSILTKVSSRNKLV